MQLHSMCSFLTDHTGLDTLPTTIINSWYNDVGEARLIWYLIKLYVDGGHMLIPK